MITIAILRSAGLTDAQIAKIAELEEKERLAERRERNRIHQRNHRARKQSQTDRADIADTKTNVALPKAAPGKFDEFWAVFPNRGGASNPKKPAREKFERAVKAGADPAEIIAAAVRYRDIERKAGRDRSEKIAQAVTWLNQQRWNDYPAEVTACASEPAWKKPPAEFLERQHAKAAATPRHDAVVGHDRAGHVEELPLSGGGLLRPEVKREIGPAPGDRQPKP